MTGFVIRYTLYPMRLPNLRVLFIVTAFPRYEGDIITPWLTETLKRLSAKGVKVEVFAPSYQGLKSQNIFGVKVHRFRYFFAKWEKLTHEETTPDRLKKGFFYKLLVLFYLLGGAIEIYRHCRKNRYDVIHDHWPFPHFLFGYIGKLASIKKRPKLVSSFYGVELRWVKTKMPFFKPFLSWGIKKSDIVTAISSYTANLVREFVPIPVKSIPFGAAIKESTTVSGQRTTDREKRILFVGRLVERKGVAYLIEAFEILSKNWSLFPVPSSLIIVGDGSEAGRLQKLVKEKNLEDKVKFTKAVSSPELDEYYRNCDVFVLPAITDSKGDTEGLGVVLLEAMSYKKPVIGSNLGGIVDIIKDGKTGLLVKEKNPCELANAIHRVLTDENLAKELGENGYQYIKKHFSWDAIIEKLINLYTGQ